MEELVREVEKRIEELSGEKFFVEFKQFGDFSTSAPLRIARKKGKEAVKLAEEWAKKIEIEGVEVKAERGFLNFFLTTGALRYNLENITRFSAEKKRRVAIDYSSPNIAKPFSVGHLRSTVIGDSLRRIYEAFGHEVLWINFFGDWGMQFGKLLAAYELWGKDEEIEKEPIKKLLELYVRFHREAEKNPELEERAREWFRRLEERDRKAMELWKKFKEWSLGEFNRIYELLGVGTDYIYAGESLFYEMGKELVEELLREGIAKIDGGAVVIPVGDDLPPLLIRKRDGTTIYATRDLASAIWRVKEMGAEELVYVVGGEQRLHFQQLFRALELMGVDVPKEHVWFGLVRLPEGKMSTRKGRVVFLEDVLREAIERVRETMRKRGVEHEEDARKIGIGAVKFADLKNNRTRDIVFTWDILKLEGETGPYVQYACVRAKRIVENANFEARWGKMDEEEEKLARFLPRFRIAVIKALEQKRPDLIANYLLELADRFNKFYERNPVIESRRPQRLYVVKKVAEVLEFGLGLLGIEVPERM